MWHVVMLAALASFVPMSAAAHPPRANALAVTEGAKATLPETSIAGPGFACQIFNRCVTAWMGTDAAHHLNFGVFEGF